MLTDFLGPLNSFGHAKRTCDRIANGRWADNVPRAIAALASASPSASITLEGMIWVQGEGDISGGSTMWNAYEANLTAFINDIGETYGHTMPFLISRLSSLQTNLNATGLAVVRAAQQTVAEADLNADWLDTESFGMSGDNLHFNAAGYQSIGTAAATKMLGMLP